MTQTRKRFLKGMIGSTVRVGWLDPTGFIQSRLAECKPSLCHTQGVLLKVEPTFVVIASSQYVNDPVEQIVDATAITKGCVQSITVLKG
jgi:hypothetical protein